ncbi:hypothetical protein, partial [Streptomyces sp. NPDC003374]
MDTIPVPALPWLSGFCRAKRAPGVSSTYDFNVRTGALSHMTSSTETTATTPQVAVNDIGNEEAFLAAIDETIKYFNDGDIV